MTIKKYVKKVGKNLYSSAKKRYVKKGQPNIKNIVSDVKWLKSVLNPEKKRFQITPGSQLIVGQVNGNSSGAYYLDVSPKPAQGQTNSTRNGSSIKLHSTDMKIQFWSQSALYSMIKGAIYWVQIVGEPYTDPSIAFGEFMSLNPFSGIRDYNSDRAIDSMRNFKVLRRKNFIVRSNDMHGTGTQSPVVLTTRLGCIYKNYHCRFDGDTTTINAGQIMMFVVCDNGNCGQSTSTLAYVPQVGANTGLKFMYDITHYYYDN